jgi:5'-3' exonuclease
VKPSDLTCLLDGDSLIWRCGFAVEEDDPPEFSIQVLKRTVESVCDQFKDTKVFISGDNNFRYSVATIQPYKGNRAEVRKPIHYSEMRDYLQRVLKATVCHGREADDAIGEAQWTAPKDTTCIVTQDKDLNTIIGPHYNHVKEKFHYVSRLDADLFLLWQVIQGDRTDNIPGLFNYGKQKATKIIKESGRSIEKAKQAIKALYQQQFGDRWRETLHEVTTLLFIHREQGKTYQDYIGSW